LKQRETDKTYNIHKATALVTAGWVACAAMMTIGGAANAQSVLDSVKSKGKITVATEVAYPPMEYLEGGKVVGYGKGILDLVVADRVIFMDQGQIIEENNPKQFFEAPENARTQKFLKQVLVH
jgi:ABC-type amino acid transport substrate-binding protein